MKAELAFALLVVLISSVSLSETHERRGRYRPDSDYPELINKWVLEFDHASRNGVGQDSNRFAV
jgi:hypothetical protein